MCLRVNVRQSTGAQYLARLEAAGLAGRLVGAQTIVLDAPVPVDRLPGFADGAVSVQDAAAQRAGNLLVGAGLPPGARVLDACAAPGGKTAHLLELADLDVLALDSRPAAPRARGRHARAPAPEGAHAGGRRPPPGRLVGRPALRRDPARRPVQRLGHRAPPPGHPLAAPLRGHRRAGQDPGASCWTRCGRRSSPAAGCCTPPARCSGPRASTRSTHFCNAAVPPAPIWTAARPATCCRCRTMVPPGRPRPAAVPTWAPMASPTASITRCCARSRLPAGTDAARFVLKQKPLRV